MTSGIKITKDGEQVLRDAASAVPVTEIQSKKIKNIIQNMSQALSEQHKFGVAIAAPQVGESVRIFVVSGKALSERGTDIKNLICINPKIIKSSKKRQQSHESCLSIQGRPAERGPDVAGIVERPKQVTIEYYDEQGIKKQRGASGLLAAIFDHEIDHLNGTLFIDKTIDEWEIDKDFNRVS